MVQMIYVIVYKR